MQEHAFFREWGVVAALWLLHVHTNLVWLTLILKYVLQVVAFVQEKAHTLDSPVDSPLLSQV